MWSRCPPPRCPPEGFEKEDHDAADNNDSNKSHANRHYEVHRLPGVSGRLQAVERPGRRGNPVGLQLGFSESSHSEREDPYVNYLSRTSRCEGAGGAALS